MNSVPGVAEGRTGLTLAAAVAIVYATSLAILMLDVAPAVELQLRQEAGLSVSQIGALFFVELATMGLATLPAYAWLGRIDEARVAQCAYALLVLGNLLSVLLLTSFPWLVAARAVTGAGAGTLMVLGMTAGARARDPNRMYALITFGQLASGALALYALSALFADGRGLRGIFVAGALLGMLGLLTARPFAAPGARATLRQPSPVPPGERKALALAIAFALVFNIVVGGLWTFAGEYASAAGLSQLRIAQVLTWGTLVGLAGAALAFAIGDRFARRDLLLAGYLSILLGTSILHLVPGNAGFAAGCYLLSFGWNLCVPYILAAVAVQDSSGRAMSSMNLAFASGLGLGPLLAGAIVDGVGLDALAPCMLGGLALGALLMLRVTRQPEPSAVANP